MRPHFLVTGARGFLGPFLAAELRRRFPGSRVTLSHRSPAPGCVPCDLLDRAAVRRLAARLKPSVIFHLAGTTKARDWEGLWDAHVRATANLLDAAARLPAAARPKVIIASSSAEYGAASGTRPLSESVAPRPVSAYGASKLSQTLLALSYRHEGLDVVIARIFNAVGPGMPGNLVLGSLSRQIAEIEKGLRPPRLDVGSLSPRRDFIDARDVAAALCALALRGRPGEIYNVCSGRAVSISDLLARLLAHSPAKIGLRRLASRRKPGDIPCSVGSHAKLTARTGWKPRIPLDRSLAETLSWQRRRAS